MMLFDYFVKDYEDEPRDGKEGSEHNSFKWIGLHSCGLSNRGHNIRQSQMLGNTLERAGSCLALPFPA